MAHGGMNLTQEIRGVTLSQSDIKEIFRFMTGLNETQKDYLHEAAACLPRDTQFEAHIYEKLAKEFPEEPNGKLRGMAGRYATYCELHRREKERETQPTPIV